MPLTSPYNDILAARDAARLNRVAPVLRVPARIRDNGTPSPRAIDARNDRIAASVADANLLDAICTARGDYTTVTAQHLIRRGKL